MFKFICWYTNLWSPTMILSTASQTDPAALNAASKLHRDTAVSGSRDETAEGWSGIEAQS